MFDSLLPFAAVILFALTPGTMIAPAAQDAAPPVKPATSTHTKVTAESLAKAKKLYQIDCAMCHADNGSGATEMSKAMQLKLDDWSDPKTLAGKTDEELFDTIRKGKDKMPPEDAARAKDDEIWNVIVYIRRLPSNPPAGESAAKSN